MYFCFVGLIIFSYFIWNKMNRKLVLLFFSITIGIIYSLRSIETGNDTEQYYYYYITVINKSLTNPFIVYFEPLYHFIISRSPSFQFYLFIVTFLTMLLISLTFRFKKTWLSGFLLLILFGFFNVATDQSRQLLGLSLFIYLIDKLGSRRVFISGLIAGLVHVSNIIISPFIYFFVFLERKKKNIPNILYFLLLLFSIILAIKKYFEYIVFYFLSIYIPSSAYLRKQFYSSDDIGLGLMIYRSFFVFILISFFYHKKKSIGFNILFIGLLLQIASVGFMPIERIGNSLFYLGLLLSSKKELILNSRNWKVIIVYLYALLYFIQTNIMDIEKNGSVPWV